ncbi:MAG: Gfo/Idh/MocA family oxidoreductase [Phycisphaerae bacterium]|jgi:predicted dehydrogenase
MVLNSAQRKVGSDNYRDAVKITRRQVLTGALAVPGAAGMYWGYGRIENGNPVKVAILGTGNQGRAHIGSINPDYLQVVAYSDIRPSNQKAARLLLNDKFGEKAEGIKLYEDYEALLRDQSLGVEMVIIALPLHLHKPATLAALEAGKHVLCEKLMAKTVRECKDMVRKADEKKLMLAIGHQRHYSYLYANCRSIIEEGAVLGDIRHIRAYWHRNQTNAGAPDAKTGRHDGWFPPIPPEDLKVDFSKYQYNDLKELVRWRVYNRTGGGLMAELGSHQLDACSIFLGKKHPVAVHGTGLTSFFTDGREVEDHIFLTFEFGPDANNAVVTYSSINTNVFDGYGEQVMGTRGTMIVQEEREAYIFREPKTGEGGSMRDTRVSWAEERTSRPVAEGGSTARWVSGAETPDTLTSRGYREEQEHMAWLIRNPDAMVLPSRDNPHPENDKDPARARGVPRCHGRVALADAVIALTANLSMKHKTRIEFKDEWFDPYHDDVPEDRFAKKA